LGDDVFQELAPVISNRQMMPGVFLLEIESPGIASEAHPGQFIMAGCDSGYGRLLRRPISIHRATLSTVSMLFAVVGTGTGWLSARRPGEKVDLLGPVGNCFSISPQSKKILLVAGGMGIAPLCFLAGEALKKGRSVRLLMGAGTACQLCPEIMIPSAAKIIGCTDDGTAGYKGLVTDLLPENTDWADQIFVCGPLVMYQTMDKKYRSLLRNKPVEVSLEVRMGCGLGFCYACTINTRQGLKQVCKDGPVFSWWDVLWGGEEENND
jgi:dihydroorotate dehydrogenase electron transfer subunit